MEVLYKFCVHCGQIHEGAADWCSSECESAWNRIRVWWDKRGDRIRSRQGNPNEKIFDNIDTKEKAYWLGILHSDGFGVKDRSVALSQHAKDIQLIEKWIRFIGIKPSLMSYPRTQQPKQCVVRFSNFHLATRLKQLGVVLHKARYLRLPKTESSELLLSWLMGYYDGDGTQNSTTIAAESKRFLLDICEKFDLPFQPTFRSNHWGTCYEMSLGVVLFDKMTENYKKSLPRKRYGRRHKRAFKPNEKRLLTWEERCLVEREKHKPRYRFKPNPTTLADQVQKLPMTQVGKIYGVSDTAIKKRCRTLGIALPKNRLGYWAKKRAVEKNGAATTPSSILEEMDSPGLEPGKTE